MIQRVKRKKSQYSCASAVQWQFGSLPSVYVGLYVHIGCCLSLQDPGRSGGAHEHISGPEDPEGSTCAPTPQTGLRHPQ